MRLSTRTMPRSFMKNRDEGQPFYDRRVSRHLQTAMANFAPLIGESLSHDHTDLIVGDVKQSIYRWRNSDWSLLNEGVQSLFRPSQYSERSMNMNYRSCACIVEFNNRIFGEAARLLQQKLEREIEESALFEGSFDVKIEKAYADIGQRVADSNLLRSGHVSVTMWESDKRRIFITSP